MSLHRVSQSDAKLVLSPIYTSLWLLCVWFLYPQWVSVIVKLRIVVKLILYGRENQITNYLLLEFSWLPNHRYGSSKVFYMTSRQPYLFPKKISNGDLVGAPSQSCGGWALYLRYTIFSSNKFALLLATWVKTCYSPYALVNFTTNLYFKNAS